MLNLQSRIFNILTKPKEEWPAIANESTDVVTLYKEYVAPLSAIPALSGFLGMTMIGVTVPFTVGNIRTPISSAFTELVVGYILALLATYLAALVVNKLAPTFQSAGGIVPALKMVAFSSTAVWVTGIVRVVPALGALVLLAALYGIYLFYLGLPSVMKTPADNVIPYTIVCAVVIVVISVVLASVAGVFTGVARMF
jgi:Yip1 domain